MNVLVSFYNYVIAPSQEIDMVGLLFIVKAKNLPHFPKFTLRNFGYVTSLVLVFVIFVGRTKIPLYTSLSIVDSQKMFGRLPGFLCTSGLFGEEIP